MTDYERIEHIIHYLEKYHDTQPDLATLAKQVKLSPSHLHKLFTRWAGITPKDFLQYLTLNHAKVCLHQGESVLDAALDSGLSGPGRLHDLAVSIEAASPGEIKSGGAQWTIQAGFAPSPFGLCLIAQSPRGICHLSFVESIDHKLALRLVGEQWPQARVQWADALAIRLAKKIFKPAFKSASNQPLRVFVKATQFQVRVWSALLRVSKGRVISYQALARAAGVPGAARAVGSAMAQNPVAYLIPCHRVIRQSGVLGEYHWGKTRKKIMSVWESRQSIK